MTDHFIRLGLLLIGGLLLALLVAWYIRFAYQEYSGTGEVVIDPLSVVGDGGRNDDALGNALAQMLQSRLELLTMELADAQAGLMAPPSAASPDTGRVGNVRLWTQNVTLQTSLFQPAEMKLTVGGVEVGGVVPWLQRTFSSRRTLHFSVYTSGDTSQVVGSLVPLGFEGAGVRVVVKGADSKAPGMHAVIDALAHEIVRRQLGRDPSNKLELLDAAEFAILADIVQKAGAANRRSLLGRPSQKEFADLLPRITALADKVPDWRELNYFTAWMADKARETSVAETYYRRVLQKEEASKDVELLKFINARLEALKASAVAVATTPGPVPGVVDLSADVKWIHDTGTEGSVVGHALATALEYQIKKTLGQERRISSRYLYYLAREASGMTGMDTGATILDGIKALQANGAVEEDVWPYVAGEFAQKPPPGIASALHFRITDARAINNIDDAKQALAKVGPVVAGIAMYESAMGEEPGRTGVIPMPKERELAIGGHAITLVGYDDNQKRFKFVNSWGPAWGENGFGYVSYDYMTKDMSDAWVFEASPPSASAPQPPPER